MVKTLNRICTICKSEFEIIRKRGFASRKVCSEQCRKKRDDEIKKLSNSKTKPIRYAEATRLSKEWNIPIHTIWTYGIKFLIENPSVVEVLKAQVRLSGHYRYLTDEEKEIRRKAVEKDNNRKQRQKKGYETKNCVVCNSQFTHQFRSTRAITCSDQCSKVRHLSKVRECGMRYRNKLTNK